MLLKERSCSSAASRRRSRRQFRLSSCKSRIVNLGSFEKNDARDYIMLTGVEGICILQQPHESGVTYELHEAQLFFGSRLAAHRRNQNETTVTIMNNNQKELVRQGLTNIPVKLAEKAFYTGSSLRSLLAHFASTWRREVVIY